MCSLPGTCVFPRGGRVSSQLLLRGTGLAGVEEGSTWTYLDLTLLHEFCSRICGCGCCITPEVLRMPASEWIVSVQASMESEVMPMWIQGYACGVPSHQRFWPPRADVG
mmetsp:Transcript_37579/g.120945  ORF Transcript_37579/g.120945 Transcript_37579/m.120945 type:complete len:109 (-) Transcript_37579:57-383(-)